MPDFAFERASGGRRVAGIDEAGRGPWAGPVIAAAVVLDADRLGQGLRDGLDDSKKLSAATRQTLFAELRRGGAAAIGVGRAEAAEIDALNILRASLLAMTRAMENLGIAADTALVDGNHLPALACPATAIVGGDARSLSIAAASIVAKVTRDEIMVGLARLYPGYGWERNKGYGTKEHRAALERLGVNLEHRKSFAPIRKMLGEAAK